MNIFKELAQDLKQAGQKLYADQELWQQSTLEIPKDPLNGDISTNIAMLIAAKQRSNPRAISLQLKEAMKDIPYIAHIEVAGPGFLNFTIKAEKWHQCIHSILNDEPDFWEVDVGQGKKVNIEYVSANPTGPMHIGHARGAVYGDSLANILSKCGYIVTKEYYINDAGAQIDTLLDSVFLRYQENITKQQVTIPSGLYPGEYLKPVAQKLADIYQQKLLEMPEDARRKTIKPLVIEYMLDLIKADLAELGVHHDVFFSEQSLHDQNKIQDVIDILTDKQLVYTGTLPPPKGKKQDDWQSKAQLLFRSSKFGDDQDRPIVKSDGSWSYLAGDFAYAQDKIQRGFDYLIYVLGADHSGYVKRIEAVIHALSDGHVKSSVQISQLVNFVKQGQAIKMSKRSGNFMTVKDVTDEVGKDIIRFIMLTRRNDMKLDFDFDKVKEQSKDNPVFYVQYAHVRAKSIIEKAKETIPAAYEIFINQQADLAKLATEEEIQLIKALAAWPKILASAARNYEPQRIAYYLIDIASRFHAIWHLGRENNDYRFNVEENELLTAARLTLAESIRKVIARGFTMIGVTPLEKM